MDIIRKCFAAVFLVTVLSVSSVVNASTLVKDINTTTSSASSSPHYFVDVGGVRYFVASDDIHGTELWKSDGTAAVWHR